VIGGVLFQFAGKGARWVEIAGDFNRWIPETLIRRSGEGLWQKVVPITKGIYRYKYIVDGEWQIDPYHAIHRANAYGSMDSYLELS
jgi:1,4-alpha-glucan branching enzyme